MQRTRTDRKLSIRIILSFPLHLPLFQNFNVHLLFPERDSKLNSSVWRFCKHNFKVCFPSSFTVQWVEEEHLECLALNTDAREMHWSNTWLTFLWIVFLFIFPGRVTCCQLKEIGKNGCCIVTNMSSYLCNQALSVINKDEKLKVTVWQSMLDNPRWIIQIDSN